MYIVPRMYIFIYTPFLYSPSCISELMHYFPSNVKAALVFPVCAAEKMPFELSDRHSLRTPLLQTQAHPQPC